MGETAPSGLGSDDVDADIVEVQPCSSIVMSGHRHLLLGWAAPCGA